MTIHHVATINAYANKYGSFTGAILKNGSDEAEYKRFDSLCEARNWCKMEAWERFGPISYAPMRRKGEYLANCWRDK